MGIEIERKFLVIGNEWRELKGESLRITQGYLFKSEEKVVRVRLSGSTAFLCVKIAKSLHERMEFEYNIPVSDAAQLLNGLKTIRKTRHIIIHDGDKWEVDEFDNGLVVAEIELNNIDQPVSLPAWIGEEVTGRPEYINSNMI